MADFELQPNPWARISEIAQRVGVPPFVSGTDGAALVATGADGRQYDVMRVVVAVLDRLDNALKK